MVWIVGAYRLAIGQSVQTKISTIALESRSANGSTARPSRSVAFADLSRTPGDCCASSCTQVATTRQQRQNRPHEKIVIARKIIEIVQPAGDPECSTQVHSTGRLLGVLDGAPLTCESRRFEATIGKQA